MVLLAVEHVTRPPVATRKLPVILTLAQSQEKRTKAVEQNALETQRHVMVQLAVHQRQDVSQVKSLKVERRHGHSPLTLPRLPKHKA